MSVGMQQPIKETPFYRDETRPFLQRHDSMSLDIIRPKDVPRGKVMFVKDEDKSLKTNDIPRCQPTYEHLNYLDKPDLSVGNTDVLHAGGKARSYYAPMDRRPRDLSLTTADIELAQPRGVRHKGDRHTDPVCPNYKLPTAYKREATPPRWGGRHTNDISDIEKSHSRVLHPDRNYIRDPNEGRDIEYSTPNYVEKLKATNARPRLDRSLNVKDISEPKRMRPRCTNPLDPQYKVPTNAITSLHAKYNEEHGMSIEVPRAEVKEIGYVEGSKPRKLTWDNGEPHLSLLREDIAGTVPQRWVGSIPANIYDPPDSRPMISFHDPHDIPGAQVGTLKKGIETRRSCNPLNPKYGMLDGNARPQPVPTFEAQRHPMLRSQAAASSMPNLRGGSRGATPQMTPLRTPQPSAQQMQAESMAMQRQALEGAVPQQNSSGSQLGSQRNSRAPSACGSPPPEYNQAYMMHPGAHPGQMPYMHPGMDGPGMGPPPGQYYEQQMPSGHPGMPSGMPEHYGLPPGQEYMQPGQQPPVQQTIRFDLGSQDGMMSRRSHASSCGSLPRVQQQY
eukprot:TRINITY_DN97987_c0_g1_i1.p1 TRINITY_DN97987_c0_g1~~TRINITY_DN97987_c0_g1_i1.p1  ORF type:complete len:560 (+),score=70.36 TRINITY_DN97987_c0_g1_i1:71-1750(+)